MSSVGAQSLTPPPYVEANYKPLVALVFAIILAAVGLWSSKKRPWKDGKDGMAVAKTFMITSLPFVIAEAATGVISYLTGALSIPPVIGPGFALDAAIFAIGVCILTARTARKTSKKEEIPGSETEE